MDDHDGRNERDRRRGPLGLRWAGLCLLTASAACAPGDSGGDPPRDVVDDGRIDADDGAPDGEAADGPADLIDDGPREIPPADFDRDGLSDDDEASWGTDPALEDTDGDGYSDGVEVLAGTNPTDPDSVIPPTDYYMVLPLGSEEWRELEFTARLGKGDVLFLVDTTGSMATAINNVRSSLSGVIVPGTHAAIADLVMGVGDYRDFPVDPFGSPGDWTFQLRQGMTDDVGAVQTALNGLRVGGGGDGPESLLEGLYHSVEGGSCSLPGAFGQVCFRPDSHPIVVVVTDAAAHNDGVAENAYDGTVTARTWSETIGRLNDRNVKIVGAAVKVLALIPSDAQADLERAARETGSFDRGGSPTVFPVVGGAVSEAVVGGIVDLVTAETQDVAARAVDDPADALDATRFIPEIHPSWASDAVSSDDYAFYGVSGGTTVVFSLLFRNDFQPAEDRVQIYRATIEVHDLPGGTALDVRQVYIVIPAEGGLLI